MGLRYVNKFINLLFYNNICFISMFASQFLKGPCDLTMTERSNSKMHWDNIFILHKVLH